MERGVRRRSIRTAVQRVTSGGCSPGAPVGTRHPDMCRPGERLQVVAHYPEWIDRGSNMVGCQFNKFIAPGDENGSGITMRAPTRC
jgi:hypothetical protein